MRKETLSRLVPEPDKFLAGPPKSPEVWRLPDASISSIFDLAEFDRIIASGLMTGRHVRITRNNVPVPQSDYTWGAGAPNERLRGVLKSHTVNRLIRSGATLVVNELEYFCDAVGDLCRHLVLETGQKLTTGAFLTPASSSGLPAHQDVESVLLMQTYGSKNWQLTAPSRPNPLEHERSRRLSAEDVERIDQGKPDLEVTLRAGEALWIPRGWIHANTTTEEPSLHLTIGFTPYTRHWLAEEVIRELNERLSDCENFRVDLPWDIADKPQELEAEVAAIVDQMLVRFRRLDQGDVTTRVREKMGERFFPPKRSHPISTAVGSDAGLDMRVVLVNESVNRTEHLPDGRLRLNLRDTAVTVPSAASDWLESRFSSDSAAEWSARDMMPGLDEASAVDLVTTLIRQGVVRAV